MVDLPYKPKYVTACVRCQKADGVVHVELSLWLCRVCDRVVQLIVNELGLDTVRRVLELHMFIGPHHLDPRHGLKSV